MTAESPISPLVADLITASLSMTHDTTTRLIDSLTEQLDTAHARADAVESGILALLTGPYAPSTTAIERALYPSDNIVDLFRKGTE